MTTEEQPPWAGENRWPEPEEFVRWYESQSSAKRVSIIGGMIDRSIRLLDFEVNPRRSLITACRVMIVPMGSAELLIHQVPIHDFLRAPDSWPGLDVCDRCNCRKDHEIHGQ